MIEKDGPIMIQRNVSAVNNEHDSLIHDHQKIAYLGNLVPSDGEKHQRVLQSWIEFHATKAHYTSSHCPP